MSLKELLLDWLIRPEKYYINKYLLYLRKEEKYTFISPNKVLAFWYRGKKNRLGARIGFIIHAGCFDEGLTWDAREVGTCIVTGQAAGTAAALCVREGTSPEHLQVDLLQGVLRQRRVRLVF